MTPKLNVTSNDYACIGLVIWLVASIGMMIYESFIGPLGKSAHQASLILFLLSLVWFVVDLEVKAAIDEEG